MRIALADCVFLLGRDLHFCIAARPCRVHRLRNFGKSLANRAPAPLRQYDQRNCPAFEILLVADALIGGYKNVETGLFCGTKQLAISQCVPALLSRFTNNVASEYSSESSRHIIVQ